MWSRKRYGAISCMEVIGKTRTGRFGAVESAEEQHQACSEDSDIGVSADEGVVQQPGVGSTPGAIPKAAGKRDPGRGLPTREADSSARAVRDPSVAVPQAAGGQAGTGSHVPCVKRPFEWEIHGSANLTTFCCVLRVTGCHHVRFSCYLRQKHGTIHVCKLEVLTPPAPPFKMRQFRFPLPLVHARTPNLVLA